MMVVRVTIEIVAMIIGMMVNGEEKEKVVKMGNIYLDLLPRSNGWIVSFSCAHQLGRFHRYCAVSQSNRLDQRKSKGLSRM